MNENDYFWFYGWIELNNKPLMNEIIHSYDKVTLKNCFCIIILHSDRTICKHVIIGHRKSVDEIKFVLRANRTPKIFELDLKIL